MTHLHPSQSTKPTNLVLSEWLAKQYDQPQQVHCGPEALAWDSHGLQQANTAPPVRNR